MNDVYMSSKCDHVVCRQGGAEGRGDWDSGAERAAEALACNVEAEELVLDVFPGSALL